MTDDDKPGEITQSYNLAHIIAEEARKRVKGNKGVLSVMKNNLLQAVDQREARIEECQQELATLDERLEQATIERRKSTAALAETEKRLADMKSDKAKLEAELSDYQGRGESTRKELKKIETEKEAADNKVKANAGKIIGHWRTKYTTAEQDRKAAEDAMKKAEAAMEKAKKEMQKASNAAKTNMLDNQQKYGEMLTRLKTGLQNIEPLENEAQAKLDRLLGSYKTLEAERDMYLARGEDLVTTVESTKTRIEALQTEVNAQIDDFFNYIKTQTKASLGLPEYEEGPKDIVDLDTARAESEELDIDFVDESGETIIILDDEIEEIGDEAPAEMPELADVTTTPESDEARYDAFKSQIGLDPIPVEDLPAATPAAQMTENDLANIFTEDEEGEEDVSEAHLKMDEVDNALRMLEEPSHINKVEEPQSEAQTDQQAAEANAGKRSYALSPEEIPPAWSINDDNIRAAELVYTSEEGDGKITYIDGLAFLTALRHSIYHIRHEADPKQPASFETLQRQSEDPEGSHVFRECWDELLEIGDAILKGYNPSAQKMVSEYTGRGEIASDYTVGYADLESGRGVVFDAVVAKELRKLIPVLFTKTAPDPLVFEGMNIDTGFRLREDINIRKSLSRIDKAINRVRKNEKYSHAVSTGMKAMQYLLERRGYEPVAQDAQN